MFTPDKMESKICYACFAGISAGKRLSEAGITDFVILEATDRIGGRIHKTKFADVTVEMGANWVEGVNGGEMNPIWAMANGIGGLNLRTFHSDFGLLAKNTYKEDMPTGPSTPVDMVVDYFRHDFEFGEPPRATSLQNTQPLPTFNDFGHDVYFVADPRGYESVVYHVARQYLRSDRKSGAIVDPRLTLNTVVREITYSPRGVTVRTEDDTVYQADYVVVSASLGVLQTDLIQFKPHLPSWKIMSIYQFNMAVYTKIFLKFPKRFWPEGPGTEFFLHASRRRGYYPVWQQFGKQYPGSNVLLVTAPVGRVYFTGEHTSEKYNGYVHGAYLAGIDSADILINCAKKKMCKYDLNAKHDKSKGNY
ncbi:unnamed protein product [Alopecurus aequalis]